MGTRNGLNRLDRATDTFTHYQHEAGNPNSLSSKVVRAVYESPAEPGVLWIGTKKGLDGLNGFDRAAETFIHYEHEQGNPHSLSNNEVRVLFEDQAGTLWIGLKGGLNTFVREEERFVWYTEEEGLPNSDIAGFAEDEHGSLWICTNRGVSKFDPAGETFKNYDHEDGLINTQFEYNACLRSRSGRLFVGGNNGIDVFHPDSLPDNRHVPPIVITDFKKQGQPASLDKAIYAIDEITLSYKDNFFSFEFAALDYRNPLRNQYAYQLENLDPDWTYAGVRGLATYTDVDPGEYVFRVKGSNNDGIWNEEGIAVRVMIMPPWWQTWWFRVLGGLGLLGLLLGGYRLRIRSITACNRALQQEIARREKAEAQQEAFVEELEAKNAELERFTYTVSHDLKSPLVTIKGFLGLLEKDLVAGKAEGVKSDVEQINSAADKMQRLLNELLEHRTEVSRESLRPVRALEGGWRGYRDRAGAGQADRGGTRPRRAQSDQVIRGAPEHTGGGFDDIGGGAGGGAGVSGARQQLCGQAD